MCIESSIKVGKTNTESCEKNKSSYGTETSATLELVRSEVFKSVKVRGMTF